MPPVLAAPYAPIRPRFSPVPENWIPRWPDPDQAIQQTKELAPSKPESGWKVKCRVEF